MMTMRKRYHDDPSRSANGLHTTNRKRKTKKSFFFWLRNSLFLIMLMLVALAWPWIRHVTLPVSRHDDDQQRDLIASPPLLVASSLESPSQQCSIPYYPVSIQDDVGSKQPVLLSGWKIPMRMATQETFSKDNGQAAFYIKDSFVQISAPECFLSFRSLWKHILSSTDTAPAPLAFTNDKENEAWFQSLPPYSIPAAVHHITGFSVFSVLHKGQSHSFHKHGESWIAAAAGYKVWWFLPPESTRPPKENACDYLTGKRQLPPGATTCVQSPGTVIWFPKDWYHATCALSDWTVGIGKQQGPLIRQEFPSLPQSVSDTDDQVVEKLKKCISTGPKNEKEWKWYDGNLTQYYNDLEKDHKRNPNDVSKYAVHRWMGEKRSTLTHYELIHDALSRYHNNQKLVLDAGCGLGSALMWMEKQEPSWTLHGLTISDEQLQFIQKELPQHNFQVKLKSYDVLDGTYDAIYSIEALIHSTDIAKTMTVWAEHLSPDGTIVIIDDFLSPGIDRTEPDIVFFCKSWLANSLLTTVELHAIARQSGLQLVESRDLLAEYRIVELNYGNSIPQMDPDQNKNHQGWMGSKLRQKLTVEGKLGYNMVVFRKKNHVSAFVNEHCQSVPSSLGASSDTVTQITIKDECLSGWYCCNKGSEYLGQLAANRTHNYAFLKLDDSLFGNYMEKFATHLERFYKGLPKDYAGHFLDIGATGATSSGMKQVTTKFQHFSGPLEYWMLDSDIGAKALNKTIYCDVCDCPDAFSCNFDVTFSHTVLEHASHPDKAFDTIARITKKGGLTMHLVPWSYQYHATPDDFYRFSHSALKVLLEDRGFEVLDVGYDLCSKPNHSKKRVDEHYDFIWLTYVVGRKK